MGGGGGGGKWPRDVVRRKKKPRARRYYDSGPSLSLIFISFFLFIYCSNQTAVGWRQGWSSPPGRGPAPGDPTHSPHLRQILTGCANCQFAPLVAVQETRRAEPSPLPHKPPHISPPPSTDEIKDVRKATGSPSSLWL